MSLIRQGLARFCVPAVALLATASPAAAGELENCLRDSRQTVKSTLLVADPDLGLTTRTQDLDLGAVPLADLSQVADFHPETDRWTARTNRIKTSLLVGIWSLSGELDIDPTPIGGFRLGWEVPGFIAIRWDSVIAPVAQLEVKGGLNQEEDIDGYVHAHNLSLGIFNPELSIANLAFWAGFGGGLVFYQFNDSDVFVNGDDYDFDGGSDESNFNISGHIFVDLDYKVVDVFHIGLGLRYHVVLAQHTDAGRFYDVNGVPASFDTGRNDGQFDDIAGIGEITLQLSLVW